MVKLLRLIDSPKPDKKLRAVFQTDKGREKNVDFGSKGNKDFTIYSNENKQEAEKKKAAYIARHRVNENWQDPTTPGALSRFILWNEPTVQASLADFKRRFNL